METKELITFICIISSPFIIYGLMKYIANIIKSITLRKKKIKQLIENKLNEEILNVMKYVDIKINEKIHNKSVADEDEVEDEVEIEVGDWNKFVISVMPYDIKAEKLKPINKD